MSTEVSNYSYHLTLYVGTLDILKPSQNKKGRKIFLAVLKMVSFLQLACMSAAEKKDTIFGAARKIFGPSYFVMALVALGSSRSRNNSTLTLVYIFLFLFDAAQI